MTTKVKKFTGGVPRLPGEQGLLGQVLTKLGNSAGDYGWRDPAIQTPNQITSDDSRVTVRVDNGNVEVIVNGDLTATFSDPAMSGLEINKINGFTVNTDLLNPPAPPLLAVDMVAPPSNMVPYTWTPAAITELIGNPGATPTGFVSAFAGATSPNGWLECNGQIIRQSDEPDLYAVIGTTYSPAGVPFSEGTLSPPPSVGQITLAGITLGGELIRAYWDPSLLQYRLRKTSLDQVTVIWDILLPGDADIASNGATNIDWDDAGNLYVRVLQTGSLTVDAVVKVSSTGSILLQTPFSGANQYNNFAIVRATGIMYFSPISSPYDIRRTNNLLVTVWTTTVNNAQGNIRAIRIDASDESILLMTISGIKKVDSTGAVLWTTSAGFLPVDVLVLPNTSVLVAGQRSGFGFGYFLLNSDNGLQQQSVAPWINRPSVGVSAVANSQTIVSMSVGADGFLYSVERHGFYHYIFKSTPGSLINPLISYSRVFISNLYHQPGSLETNYVTVDTPTGDIFYGTKWPATGSLSVHNHNVFSLPDLRGEFIRGWDNGRGVDPGRVRGSRQADEIKAHQHKYWYDFLNLSGGGAGSWFQTYTSGGSGRHRYEIDDDRLTLYELTGTETRPRNVSLMYCIKT